jgi:hypothetical protein
MTLEKELKDITSFIDSALVGAYNIKEIMKVLEPYAGSVGWGVFDSIGTDPKEQFEIVYSKDGVHIQHNRCHDYMDVVGLSAEDFQRIAEWLSYTKDPVEGYYYDPDLEVVNERFDTPDSHYEEWDLEDNFLRISKKEYHQLIYQIETLKERIKELEGK